MNSWFCQEFVNTFPGAARWCHCGCLSSWFLQHNSIKNPLKSLRSSTDSSYKRSVFSFDLLWPQPTRASDIRISALSATYSRIVGAADGFSMKFSRTQMQSGVGPTETVLAWPPTSELELQVFGKCRKRIKTMDWILALWMWCWFLQNNNFLRNIF